MAINVFAKNAAKARAAKAFLHDLTFTAGYRSTDQRQNGSGFLGNNYVASAEALCKEVLERNFNDVDKEIRYLEGTNFASSLTSSRPKTQYYMAEDIAEVLVYLAECLNLYWDDINATVHEKATFSKTILGRAVEKYERFASMVPAAPVQSANAPTAPRATSTRTPGQAPKNNYKSTGPQSGNVRDLHGTPGQKVFAQGGSVFRIVGTIANSKNVASAFVRPLTPTGASGNTNKVFVNSGNGYTDCICWFDDLSEANAFLSKVVNNATIKSNITNLQVVKNKPDSNGYYLIGTEFGECAISAKKLNEALQETLQDTEDDTIVTESAWDKFAKNKTQETLDDVHYYMNK